MLVVVRILGIVMLLISVIAPPMETHAGLASIIGKSAVKAAFRKTAAGTAGKTAARRAATKSAAKIEADRIRSAYQRDLLRDAKSPVKILDKDRLVHRYTTKEQAAREAKRGIGAGSHTTSTTDLGRPSATSAAQKYGLAGKPEVRTTWRIPQGTHVKINKTIGGKPGMGEINLPNGLAPESRIKSIDLR